MSSHDIYQNNIQILTSLLQMFIFIFDISEMSQGCKLSEMFLMSLRCLPTTYSECRNTDICVTNVCFLKYFRCHGDIFRMSVYDMTKIYTYMHLYYELKKKYHLSYTEMIHFKRNARKYCDIVDMLL